MDTPKVLSESFPMNANMTGFKWFLEIFASALEGLKMLGISQVSVALGLYVLMFLPLCEECPCISAISK